MDMRALPHNLDAERALIGAVQVHPSWFPDLRAVVGPAEFFREAHQLLWRAFEAIAAKGLEPTLPGIVEQLGEDLDRAGGPAYLARCIDAQALGRAGALTNAALVKGHAHRRAVIRASAEAAESAYDVDLELDAALDRAQRVFLDLGQALAPQGFVDGARVAVDAMDYIEALNEGRAGLSWGFDVLDESIGPLEAGQLVIVAGRPGMGKSALLSSLVRGQIRRGSVVGICSLEMSRAELGMRMLAAEASVDMMLAKRRALRPADQHRLAEAARVLSELGRQWWVEDIPDLRLSDIRTRARRLQAEHGLSCLVIDYLQLLSGEQANEKRYDEVSRLSRGMKKLAKSLGLPIVCLAQLNRGSEARADKRPMMSDLRDSGAIEQDADVIVFVHRESQYDPAADREAAELIIAKGRGGPVGTVPIRYIREFTRFEEVH